MHYTVQPGDSPARIAQRLTGNAALMGQLVAANPALPRAHGLGAVTFRELHVGQKLNLPPSWMRFGISGAPGVSGVPTVGVGDAASDLSAAQSAYTQGSTTLAGAQQVTDVSQAATYFAQSAASSLAVANDVGDSSSASQIVVYQTTIATQQAAINTASDLASAQAACTAAQAAAASALTLANKAATSGSGGGQSQSTLAQAAIAAANAITGDSAACSNVSKTGTSVNTAVHAFKVAWNAAGQSPQLAYNGQYDAACASALGTALQGTGIGAPTACAASPTPPPTQSCPSGQVYDVDQGKCVCPNGSAPDASGNCAAPVTQPTAQASSNALVAGVLIAGLGVAGVTYAIKKRKR